MSGGLVHIQGHRKPGSGLGKWIGRRNFHGMLVFPYALRRQFMDFMRRRLI